MSDQVVQEIIARAIKDETFRQMLFTNPDKALTGYNLTSAEIDTLKGLDEDSLGEYAGGLGDRLTKGKWVPGVG